nr:hypothetical protein [Paenibacillus ginsengarvi]
MKLRFRMHRADRQPHRRSFFLRKHIALLAHLHIRIGPIVARKCVKARNIGEKLIPRVVVQGGLAGFRIDHVERQLVAHRQMGRGHDRAVILYSTILARQLARKLIRIVPRHAVLRIRHSELIEQVFVVIDCGRERVHRDAVELAAADLLQDIDAGRFEPVQIEAGFLDDRRQVALHLGLQQEVVHLPDRHEHDVDLRAGRHQFRHLIRFAVVLDKPGCDMREFGPNRRSELFLEAGLVPVGARLVEDEVDRLGRRRRFRVVLRFCGAIRRGGGLASASACK